MPRKQHERTSTRRRGFRPILECLELRVTPTTVHWNIDGNGFWDVPGNWDTGQAPGAGDDVVIDRPAGNFTVTVRDHQTINTLVNKESVDIEAGGGLRVQSAGTLDSAIALNGDYLEVDAATTLKGTLTWKTGTLFTSGQGLTNAGVMALSNTSDVTLSGVLFNNATLSEGGTGSLSITNTINNGSNGLLDFQNDVGITGNGVLNNSGTIQKSAGAGLSRIGPADNSTLYFNQLGGTLDARSGSLRLDQTRTSVLETGGTWNAGAGAMLEFVGNGPSGTYFAGNFTGSGAGTVLLGSGPFGIDSGGATFNFPIGLLQWTGGTFFSNPLTNAGSITLTGATDKSSTNTINNTGTLIVAGTGNLVVSGTLNNNAGGVIDFQNDGGIAGNGVVNNAGTIRKSAGGGVSRIGPSPNVDLYLNQLGGTLDARSGSLLLDQLRTSLLETGGTWNAATGATLNIAGNGQSGTYFAGTFKGSGGGSVQLSGGAYGIDTGGAIFNFPAGLLQWTGGSFFSNPLTNAGTIILVGAGDKGFSNTIQNNGALVETGTGSLVVSGTLNNNATGVIDFRNDGGIAGNGVINNTGTIRKSASVGVSRVGPSPNVDLYLNQLGGTLDVQSGTLQLDQLRTNLLETGGTWNAATGATLNIVGNPQSGTYFAGTFTGSGGGAVQLSGGSYGIDAGGAAFNFPVGLLQWTGGSFFANPLTNTGFLTLAGATDKSLNNTINNNGTLVEIGTGNLVVAGTLNNAATGLIDFQSDAGFTGNGVVNNSGLLRKSAGGGVSMLTASLYTNQGVMAVQSGRLNLAGSGFWQVATLNADAGTVLEVSGGPALTGEITGAGLGRVEVSGGFNPVDGGLAGAAATLNFPAGYLHWTGGELGGGGSASGVGTNIPCTNAGFMTIDGPNTKSIRRNTIVNTGTIIDSGPGDLLLHGIGDFATSVIDNRAGATFELAGDVLIDELPGNKGVFINGGLLRRRDSTGTAEIDGVFNSTPSGQIEVVAGHLKFGSGGTLNGAAFNLASGTSVDFGLSSAFFIFMGNFTGTGLGTINFQGGLSGGDDSSPGYLNFAPGYFNMTGTWGGTLVNNGTITFDGNFARAHIINLGTMIMSGPDDFALNANTFIENRGLFDIQTDASLVVPGDASLGNMRFLNTGLLRKSAGTGTTSLTHAGSSKAFQLNNTGTVEVESGTLAILDPIVQVAGAALTGGNWTIGAGATLSFPSGVGLTTNQGSVTLGGQGASFGTMSGLTSSSGTFSLLAGSSFATTGGFTNSGTLTVGAGSKLTVNGALTEVAGAKLQIGIGGHPASNQFGQVSVTGQASLAGALVVQLASGFGPTQGDAYSILNYASKQGSFAALSGLPPFFSANVGASSVQLNGLASASNLAVQSITLPPSATVGQNVSISFSVQNTTTIPIDGSWTDSVYLSRSAALGPDAVLFTRVPHNGGLAALASYTGTASAALPNLIAGHYFVIVVSDTASQVPDTNQSDNTLISTGTFAVQTATLTIGAQTSGSIVNGQSLLYRVDVGSGAGDLVISTNVGDSRAADFYLGYASVPGSSASIASWANQTALQGQLIIPDTLAGAYYLLVVGREGAATPQSFSVTPRLAGFEIRELSPNHGSNAGQATVTVTGSGFTPATTVSLVSGGTTRNAAAVRYQDSSTLFATFDLTGLVAGSFGVVVADGGQNTTQAGDFTVTSGNPGNVQYRLSGPEFIRPGSIGTLTIEYWNAGDTDVQAPLFTVDTDNGLLKLPDQPAFGGEMMDVLGINHDGPAGILPPGYRTQITLSVKPEQSGIHVATNITARIDTPLAGNFDWNEFKAQLKPEAEPADAWDAVYANFVAQMGNTFSQYLSVLSADATYLSTLGEYTSDITRYITFELQKADDFGAVTQRYELGLFGRGQPASFEMRALKESTGNVSIIEAGEVRQFTLQPDGSFRATLGDAGKLVTLPDGSYQLTEADGTITAFYPNGALDYLQDANHNRITAGYNNAGQLASLVSSSRDTLSLSYNGQGRVSQIIDAEGRVTTYTYDASGQHLLSSASAAGTTSYTYVTGQGAPSENATASITLPNGASQFFTYDAQGRLAQQSFAAGADPLTYSYDASGAFTVTDGAGSLTRYFPNDFGAIARVIDPLGHATSNAFDAQNRIVGIIDPAGNRFAITRDANGNPTAIVDPLGEQTNLDFAATVNLVTSLSDPGGSTTTYAYDASGNVLTGTDASGNSFQDQYDSRGNLIQTSSQAGRVVHSTYNSVGLLIRRDYSDGTFTAYGYDAHRNLVTLTDQTGITTLAYDAADRLLKITYPGGRFVAYAYDAHGLRTQLQTSDGYALNYAYNALAQLVTVKDGSGQTLVTYSYDNAGRIQTEQFGNGTSTTYSYDAAGHVLTIVNRAADNSIASQLAYTYDALGQPITETTAAGTATYGYDAAGHLVSVQLPGGRTITYQYDAAGNRVAATDSGTATSYSTNNVNQYTSVGGATFTYDGDGNLLTRTDSTGMATYTYDAHNRLAGISSPTDTWSFEYDALGNRTASVHNGVRTEYLVDPSGLGNVIGVYDGSGNAIAHYAQGESLIAQTNPGGSNNYYSFDALGNTTALTGANGSVLDTYSYLPFGEKLSSTGNTPNPFTFVGQSGVMDDGSGLYFMRNRSYDPALGRFTQEDPSGFGGGDTNLYRYASNNPTTFIDPSGLQGSPPSGNTLNQGPVLDGLRDSFYLNKPPAIPLPPRPNEPRSPSQDEMDPRSNVQKYLDRNAIHGRYHVGFGVYDVHNDVVASAQHLISLGFTPQQALILSNKEFGKHTEVQIVSGDPNEMEGPGGAGPGNSVRPDTTLGYTIKFENESDATAPAQLVVITEQLDDHLDWNTFQLGGFGFGSYTVSAPAGRDSFQARVDARATNGVYVDISASLNHSTGVATWTFKAIDPATGDFVTDALAGFLPPNVNAPEGDGFVSYTILAKPNLTTGALVNAKATIVFDTNAPIDTAQFVNTIDNGAPTSTASVSKYVGAKFNVSWAGTDDAGGSGIDHYDVYVSDNGEAFTPFLLNTVSTSATFTGVLGHTYGFYSVATDGVGIMQPTPTAAQSTAQAILDTPNKQYIAAVYIDLLMRSVDLGGLAFWSSQLEQGAARNVIAAQLTHSAEYYKTNVIVPAYRQFLGRDADPGGIQYWTQQLQGGLTDEQMQAGFIASPEFYNKAGGTDKLWIDALYQALLDRQPDANGENYWIGQLQGHQTRAEVANDFTGSPEGLGDRVQQTYQRYLGRKAGQSEVDFWVGQYHQGNTNEDIVTGFLASDEYFKEHTS